MPNNIFTQFGYFLNYKNLLINPWLIWFKISSLTHLFKSFGHFKTPGKVLSLQCLSTNFPPISNNQVMKIKGVEGIKIYHCKTKHCGGGCCFVCGGHVVGDI